MKTITAIEMRHLTNEIIATKSLSDYDKSESPMATEIMYLEVSKEIMQEALLGNHEAKILFDEEYHSIAYDVLNQLKAQGYKVEIPSWANHIEVRW